MKRLTKEQQERQTQLVHRLREAAQAAQIAIAAYNVVIGEAETLRQEIVEAQDAYYDERSERWQESDAGQRYSDWRDEWDAAGFEPIDDVDDSLAEALEALNTAPMAD